MTTSKTTIFFFIFLFCCNLISAPVQFVTPEPVEVWQPSQSPTDTVVAEKKKVKKVKKEKSSRPKKKAGFFSMLKKFLIFLLLLAVILFGGMLAFSSAFLLPKWIGFVLIGITIIVALIFIKNISGHSNPYRGRYGFARAISGAINKAAKSCLIMLVVIAAAIVVITLLLLIFFGWKGLVILGTIVFLIKILAPLFD